MRLPDNYEVLVVPLYLYKRRFAVGATPYAIAIADWNKDKKPDLAVVNNTSNNVTLLLNQSR